MGISAGLASQAKLDRDTALRRAEEAEKKLKLLEKESQDALDKVKSDAQKNKEDLRTQTKEREDLLIGRLFSVAETLSSKLPLGLILPSPLCFP